MLVIVKLLNVNGVIKSSNQLKNSKLVVLPNMIVSITTIYQKVQLKILVTNIPKMVLF
jgi:hypothetical protein